MTLQSLAARLSTLLGRDSVMVRLLRPAYEWLLDRATGGRGFARTLNGHETLYVHPHYRGYFPPTYEPTVAAFLRERVRPGAVCLDVGAHVGVYALSLAIWSGESGRVVAFEPNPATRRVLADHVRRNRLGGRVEVRPEAISDTIGEAVLQVAALEGTNRLGTPNPAAAQTHHAVNVPLTTLDAFCADHKLDPDWILLDIEGFEGQALRGARAVLARGRVQVVAELHPLLWESAGTSRADIHTLFDELGLVVRPLTGQADPLAEAGVVFLARRGVTS